MTTWSSSAVQRMATKLIRQHKIRVEELGAESDSFSTFLLYNAYGLGDWGSWCILKAYVLTPPDWSSI